MKRRQRGHDGGCGVIVGDEVEKPPDSRMLKCAHKLRAGYFPVFHHCGHSGQHFKHKPKTHVFWVLHFNALYIENRHGHFCDGFYIFRKPAERLFIFESPIDAMSHASLVNAATGGTGAWKKDTRLSLAGTSDAALNFFLNQHKEIKALVFCLDNDKPGREAAFTLGRKYAFRRYAIFNEPPHGKDYNEDLKALRAQERARIQRKNERRRLYERDR